MAPFQRKLLIGLCVMALFSPLGIILPKIAGSGGAWGEWGADSLGKMLGYVPEGLKRYLGFWKAPVPDYNPGGEGAPITLQIVSYAISGILGAVLVVLASYVISKLIRKYGKPGR